MFFALCLMALCMLYFGLHALCCWLKDRWEKRAKASHLQPMRNKFGQPLTLLLLLFCLGLAACATLNPGADPFIVRVEQGQAGVAATVDMVLHVDETDRGFWKTNAPAFHTFCEWLRTPTPYGGTNVARCIATQANVEDLKRSYKSAKSAGTSNALFLAFIELGTLQSQSLSWSNIITSPIHP